MPDASLPTSSDNVYFDANSFSSASQTVTINTTANCLDMNWTGATNSPTLAGVANLNIYGSLSLIADMTFSYYGSIRFSATSVGKSIVSAGLTFLGSIAFNGVGGTWSLSDNITVAGDISILNGMFQSNNKNITCNGFYANGATSNRAIYLGSSTLTSSGDFANDVTTGLTFDAGTSTIKITGSPTSFKGGGLSYYNVELIGYSITVTGSNTFNDLKLTAGKTVNFTAGTTQVLITLSGDGTSGNLIAIQSTSAGSTFTLSKTSGEVNKNYYSIKDCTATGGANFIAWSSTNASGNTGWKWGQTVTDIGSGADNLALIIDLLSADVGSGADTATILATLATIADGHEHTQPMALGMGYVFDPSVDSGYGVDAASIVASLTASDIGSGLDAILPINAAISASDTGHGVDVGSVAKAFFLIDSHNILQPIGVFVMRDSKEELLPKTRDYTDAVPGRHGELDFGSELEARIMELKVHINTTPEEKTALKRTLAAYLNPLLGAKPLIDSRDIEKTYYVKYAGSIDLTNYVNALQFTIPFKASDPIIYGSFEQTQVGSGTIANDGTLECPLTITIVGAVTNPSVVVGSYTLTYTGTLTSSDTLIIDTGALTCTLNGVNAVVNLMGLTPDIVLAVGDTTVTVPASGTTTITYTERWI